MSVAGGSALLALPGSTVAVQEVKERIESYNGEDAKFSHEFRAAVEAKEAMEVASKTEQ